MGNKMKKITIITLIIIVLMASITFGFNDVNSNSWHSNAISKISAMGIMNGDNGDFRPDDNVTRAELAATIINTIEYMESDYDSKMANEIDTILSSLSSAVYIIANNGETFGSGIFLSERGRILTAYHVVKGNDVVDISPTGMTPLKARVIGYSEEYDLALLQVEGSVKLFDYVEISEYAPLILDRVYAIGNPFNLRNTISSGFISSNSYNKMQMDISINSGNSGGAILNSDGKLVGIALSIIDPSKGSGIGFGATLEQINNFLKDYK